VLSRVELASPEESAADARLSYVTDREPGIRRVGSPKRFRYIGSDGKVVRDRATLERIESLVIPPAWTDVWICGHPRGHLQATGRDARGRKQYRYHPKYREVREETKFEKLLVFGSLLPRIRRRVRQDLALPGLPEKKVIAAVVRLMDLAHIRIGNEEYARENQSFGLTTLRDRHVKIKGSHLHFEFRGKSGQLQVIELADRRLAKIVKRSRDLPGYELFQYIDESGAQVKLDSDMVNRYLREITDADITAKDFRTWHGTVHAAQELGACGEARTATEAKKNVVAAIKQVAGRLGNRPATCKKHYIHPMVLDLYQSGELAKYMAEKSAARNTGLDTGERCVLKMLAEARKSGLMRGDSFARQPAAGQTMRY
jgi:DNA topoisomerase I